MIREGSLPTNRLTDWIGAALLRGTSLYKEFAMKILSKVLSVFFLLVGVCLSATSCRFQKDYFYDYVWQSPCLFLNCVMQNGSMVYDDEEYIFQIDYFLSGDTVFAYTFSQDRLYANGDSCLFFKGSTVVKGDTLTLTVDTCAIGELEGQRFTLQKIQTPEGFYGTWTCDEPLFDLMLKDYYSEGYLQYGEKVYRLTVRHYCGKYLTVYDTAVYAESDRSSYWHADSSDPCYGLIFLGELTAEGDAMSVTVTSTGAGFDSLLGKTFLLQRKVD